MLKGTEGQDSSQNLPIVGVVVGFSGVLMAMIGILVVCSVCQRLVCYYQAPHFLCFLPLFRNRSSPGAKRTEVSTEDNQAYGVSLGGKPAVTQSSLEETVYEQIPY